MVLHSLRLYRMRMNAFLDYLCCAAANQSTVFIFKLIVMERIASLAFYAFVHFLCSSLYLCGGRKRAMERHKETGREREGDREKAEEGGRRKTDTNEFGMHPDDLRMFKDTVFNQHFENV